MLSACIILHLSRFCALFFEFVVTNDKDEHFLILFQYFLNSKIFSCAARILLFENDTVGLTQV